jgi:hypothetical protein
MQAGAHDPEELNPRKLLEYFTRIVKSRSHELDEVVVRRIISAVYFALFNYWSLKSYLKGMRGGGPLRDSFWFSTFNEHLLKQGLDYAVYTLYLYRVAADHYALNPTKVVLTSKPWKDVEKEVEINDKVLEIVLESAYDILEYLEEY